MNCWSFAVRTMLILASSRSGYLLLFFLSQCGLILVLGNVANNEYFVAKNSIISKLTNNSLIVKEILPVVNASSPVQLKIAVGLHQISSVDEVNQAIRLTVWLRLYWYNPFLQWDPNDYQGIESVHLDKENFWVPDISLFNKASLEEEVDILYQRMSTKLIIKHDGEVMWLAPATLLTQCKIDVSRFPFDEQECEIIMGSWTYSEDDINVTYRERLVDTSKFIMNGEWIVMSAFLQRNVNYYGPDKVPYPDVTFHLFIKRRPLYYVINLLIPCSLIALLSFISFVLPSNHGERVSLVITVLLANSVYMLIVSSSLPQTSDAIPVIGIYFVCIILEISFALFATCITSKIHDKTSVIPAWFDTLVNRRIARFVCIKLEAECETEKTTLAVLRNERFARNAVPRHFGPRGANGRDSTQQDLELVETGFMPNGKEDVTCAESQENEASLLSELHLLADEVRLKNCVMLLSKKWRKTARVLDRFFLILFLFIYVILTSYLLASM